MNPISIISGLSWGQCIRAGLLHGDTFFPGPRSFQGRLVPDGVVAPGIAVTDPYHPEVINHSANPPYRCDGSSDHGNQYKRPGMTGRGERLNTSSEFAICK